MTAVRHINRGGATALPLDVILSMVASLPRDALNHLIERMIDRLDQIDGDPDIEEDDWPGDQCEDEGEREVPYVPVYGIDQTSGIVGIGNMRESRYE